MIKGLVYGVTTSAVGGGLNFQITREVFAFIFRNLADAQQVWQTYLRSRNLEHIYIATWSLANLWDSRLYDSFRAVTDYTEWMVKARRARLCASRTQSQPPPAAARWLECKTKSCSSCILTRLPGRPRARRCGRNCRGRRRCRGGGGRRARRGGRRLGLHVR